MKKSGLQQRGRRSSSNNNNNNNNDNNTGTVIGTVTAQPFPWYSPTQHPSQGKNDSNGPPTTSLKQAVTTDQQQDQRQLLNTVADGAFKVPFLLLFFGRSSMMPRT